MIESARISATTLLPNDAKWDVIVVGAGPAGALAAHGLARSGAKVLLVDRAKFPRYKVCGCCLHPAALQILFKAGLGAAIARAMPTSILQLSVYGKAAEFALPQGAALSRSVLDGELAASAERAGAIFCDDTIASWQREDADSVTIELARGDERRSMRTRAVVAADGLAGSFTRQLPGVRVVTRTGSWIGAGATLQHAAFLPAQVVRMCVSRAGYVGIVRVEDCAIDFAAALDPRAVKESGGLSSLARRVVCESGADWPAVADNLRWWGTPPLTRRHTAPDSPRIFVVGDAAGYVEPFTGEGMAWALSAGQQVVEHVQRCLVTPTIRDARRWNRARDQRLRLKKLRCRLLTAGLRSRTVAMLAVGVLQNRPTLATRVLRRFYRAETPQVHPR